MSAVKRTDDVEISRDFHLIELCFVVKCAKKVTASFRPAGVGVPDIKEVS